MRVISASRRTDIPAFYTPWFMKRIDAGFCHSVNPFGGQVYRISLRPEDTIAIVFWTRNPKPLLPNLKLLRQKGFKFYFHFTVNGYSGLLESHNPPLKNVIPLFRQLADSIGPDLVHWRYDPILLSRKTPPDYHLEQFRVLAEQLAGATGRCYFSFVDFHGKTERNLAKVEEQEGIVFAHPSREERRGLVRQLREVAAALGITLFTCCDDDLVGDGVQKAHCIDLDMLRKLRPDLWLDLPGAPTRRDCGCVKCDDIGCYDTCLHGCTYCYGTNSRRAALRRMKGHDRNDTLLWRPAALQGVDLVQREFQPKSSTIEPKSNATQVRLDFGVGYD